MCNEFYGVNSCKQKTQGCLWNFPGTNDVNWHRDYPEHWELLTGNIATHFRSVRSPRAHSHHDLLRLTVVTAATEYSEDIGWILLQRGTHFGGEWWNVSSDYPPRTSRGEPPPYKAVLRKGDTLIFTATTKHAPTPNPTNVARRLVKERPAPSIAPPSPHHTRLALLLLEIGVCRERKERKAATVLAGHK